MENPNLENWDEERYKELNTYFRIKIELMLRTNPHLLAQQQESTLHLRELVAEFNEGDKERWDEFMRLDKLKLEADMWDHLHGKGTRYRPGLGFTNPEDDTTW
ncbi:hypothetical protein POKO110462_11460 [Pontibacter korlensis]|uniref:Uncharacterized protein n=1 Tax=Pontibacter korlensis TaxID=400092 RepID=A0A0E3UY68_9BACT|nr:hypothetical protein [Pontibacter korlensis]AKD04186.1 hypothetical protein PKOR_15180 [Pontibacter korlensis]